MRKIMVAGNWKMNGSESMVRTLLGGIMSGLDASCEADVVVFPPFPYLPLVQSMAGESRIQWGGTETAIRC